jgi:hypothetical protein
MGGGGVAKTFTEAGRDIRREGSRAVKRTKQAISPSNLLPDFPVPPELPDEPDLGIGLEERNALIARLRRQAIRGGGIKATTVTGAGGVTNRTPVTRRRLSGV